MRAKSATGASPLRVTTGAQSINGSKRPLRGAAERNGSLPKRPSTALPTPLATRRSGRPAACRQAARPGVQQPWWERPVAPQPRGSASPAAGASRPTHTHTHSRGGLLLGSTVLSSATHRDEQRDEPPAATPGNSLKSRDAYVRSATFQTRTRNINNNNKKDRTAGRRPPFARTRHQEAGSARAPTGRR